jgi:hypothetical protein
MNGLTLIEKNLNKQKIKGVLKNKQIGEFAYFRDVVRRQPSHFERHVGEIHRIDQYGNPVKRVRVSKKERIAIRWEDDSRFPTQEEIAYTEPYSHGPSTAGQKHRYYKGYPHG